MHTSFISEHTAELILVPEIISILSPVYPKITPFYYWATREGGIMSRECFANQLVQLMAFYPRRPKVAYPGERQIHVKLNELLFQRSRYFQGKGVPVFAGVPLADNLEGIFLGAANMWFEISPLSFEQEIDINLDRNEVSGFDGKLLEPDDLRELARSATISTWVAALQKIKYMGQSTEGEYRYWNRFAGDLYKPIYLLLHVD